MHIKTMRVPAAEAGAFEDNLISEGFLLVLKENPEELNRKEYLKRMAGSSQVYVGEDFTFIWRE